MTLQKTYWHLQGLGRKPLEYDIATSRLLYYPSRGFEVRVPVADWYEKYQQGSSLRASDWEQFRDPRETTYSKYVDLQRGKEIFVDGLLKSIEDNDYDRGLSAPWLRVLARVLPTLRYPVHGLQMLAAYGGQMAPGGRITVTCLLQAGDEMRRIQRLAYRMRQLQNAHPGFGLESRTTWQEDSLWQPLREVIEKLLVTYDWGESLVATNLVLKPAFDELFMVHFGRLAERAGDPVLGQIFLSLNENCTWHREWSEALMRMVLADQPENGPAIRGWMESWQPPVARAIATFAPVFDEMLDQPPAPGFAAVAAAIDARRREVWDAAGVGESPAPARKDVHE